MNNRISGEDIFLAIGDIDEALLEYPAKKHPFQRYIKPLTVAASLVLCLSVVLSYIFGVVLGKAGMENTDDAAGSNQGAESAPGSTTGTLAKSSVTIAFSDSLMDSDADVSCDSKIFLNANNSLLISVKSDGCFDVYVPLSIASSYEINVLRGEENAEKPDIAEEKGNLLKYTLTTDGLTEISFRSSNAVYKIRVEKVSENLIRLTSFKH